MWELFCSAELFHSVCCRQDRCMIDRDKLKAHFRRALIEIETECSGYETAPRPFVPSCSEHLYIDHSYQSLSLHVSRSVYQSFHHPGDLSVLALPQSVSIKVCSFYASCQSMPIGWPNRQTDRQVLRFIIQSLSTYKLSDFFLPPTNQPSCPKGQVSHGCHSFLQWQKHCVTYLSGHQGVISWHNWKLIHFLFMLRLQS